MLATILPADIGTADARTGTIWSFGVLVRGHARGDGHQNRTRLQSSEAAIGGAGAEGGLDSPRAGTNLRGCLLVATG